MDLSRVVRTLAVVSVGLFAFSHSAKGDTLAVDFTTPVAQQFGSFGDYNIGWQFQISQSVTVTALGYYNPGADSHQVGIYNTAASGTPVVTATISSADTPSGSWYFESLSSPLILSAGTYRIVGQSKNSNYTWGVNGLAVDSRIQLQDGYFSNGGALAYPTIPTAFVGYFGPNFLLTSQAPPPPPSAVPEPGTGMLLTVALAICGVGLRRKRQS